jgi:3-deoxy-D-arabino-heptulosonate 7-phosphate (DAHP) synthase class II
MLIKNFNAYQIVLWRVDPLLGNDRNTHAANNTRAVFSVVPAATVAMQHAIHAANNTEAVFSAVVRAEWL